MDKTAYEREYEEALAAAGRLKKRWLSAALAEEAKSYLKGLGGGFTDHEAYKDKVLPYWEQFGYIPEEFWFELAGSRDRTMDPLFVPADLLYTGIIPYLNNMQIAKGVDDKAYYDMWFPDIRQAPTVCRRVSGVYYDAGMNIISEAEAVRLCMDRACMLFIKPAINASHGRSILAVDSADTGAKELAAKFEKTGACFIVQEKIEQHPALASLCPDSVCTIRISTLMMDDRISVAHEVLRVGAPGKSVPLRGKGNYFVQILEGGRLHEKLLFFDPDTADKGSEKEAYRWEEAAGIIPEGFKVPSMERVRESAMRLHERAAHFRFIGWDFTVDKNGEPVMIEPNFTPGHIVGQTAACAPIFGAMTGRVLEDFFLERTLEKNHLQGMPLQ